MAKNYAIYDWQHKTKQPNGKGTNDLRDKNTRNDIRLEQFKRTLLQNRKDKQ
jgi:hypothetical protein